MRNVQRTALVSFSAEQMFRLVDDIEAYPAFLPWCTSARIEQREGSDMVATLELSKGGLSKSFTTRNHREEFHSIELNLVGGPFRQLQGQWSFVELGNQGSKVSLQLEFDFESRLVDKLFGNFFEDTCNALIDAFTRRAQTVYGGQAQP